MFLQVSVTKLKMSVVDLDTISNDNLRKRVTTLISLEDWADKCGICGCPILLHRDGPCKRQERKLPNMVMRIWSEFKRRVKPILATLKAEYRKEGEHSLLLDGLNRLFNEI